MGLQWLVALLSVRFTWFQRIVKSQPTLLLANGTFLEAELRDQRVVHEEIISAVRKHGFQRLNDVGAVVLETDGSFSVIGRDLDVRVLEKVRPAASVKHHFDRMAAG